MHKHVDAGQVRRAEDGGARTSDQRAGQCIDFIDLKIALLHQVDCLDHPVHTKTVADKTRHISSAHRSFAQHLSSEPLDGLDTRGVRLGSRNGLEQVQVARWIEEVRTEESLSEAVRTSLDQTIHRNARRVAGDDGRFGEQTIQSLEERAFGLELLDDCLDNPITRPQLIEIVLGIADFDQGHPAGIHEGGGSRLERAVESTLGR